MTVSVAEQTSGKLTADQAHTEIDRLELHMLQTPAALVNLPLVHRFVPGMYVREIFNPAGTLITTKIHKTEHPFVVLKGRVSVFVPGGGFEHITAPYMGITRAGTRRVIYVHEDTVWVTFHANPTDTQDLDEIESVLIERREISPGLTAHDLFKRLVGEGLVREAPDTMEVTG